MASNLFHMHVEPALISTTSGVDALHRCVAFFDPSNAQRLSIPNQRSQWAAFFLIRPLPDQLDVQRALKPGEQTPCRTPHFYMLLFRLSGRGFRSSHKDAAVLNVAGCSFIQDRL